MCELTFGFQEVPQNNREVVSAYAECFTEKLLDHLCEEAGQEKFPLFNLFTLAQLTGIENQLKGLNQSISHGIQSLHEKHDRNNSPWLRMPKVDEKNRFDYRSDYISFQEKPWVRFFTLNP